MGAEVPKPAQVMGLLKANCMACHNAEEQKGGLSLETRDEALKGGENGPAFVSGKAAQSALIKSLAEDADPHMPPKKQLASKHVAMLKHWVDAGASWDEAALKAFGETAPADKLGPLPATPSAVVALAVSPDGKKLAIGRENRVQVHDLGKPDQPVLTTLEGHKDLVQSLAWSPDGKTLATGGYRTVLVFDASTWQVTHTLAAPLEGRVTAMAFLPDTATLVLADGAQGQRGLVHFWPLGEGKPAATIEAHTDNILSLALSRDGKLLATGGADFMAKVWDVASRKETAKLEGHTNHVLALAFNPDGTQLATGGADKELKVWDVRSKEQLMQLGDRSAPVVTGLHWTADGAKIYTVNDQGAPRVYTELKSHDGVRYKTDGGKERKLTGIETPLFSISMPQKDEVIYAGSESGSVFTWDKDGKLSPLSPPDSNLKSPISNLKSLSFTRDVLPILSKAGCNLGSCHAKASGQAGFKLSIFAYDPKGDFRELTQDAHGRRIFPALPEESLMLRKATASLLHEGGQRFEPDSAFARTIAEWIRQGSPYELPGQAALTGITASP
jgi:WD40 repeat protein